MDKIQDVVGSVIANISAHTTTASLQQQILAAWEETIGKRVAKHTRIASFKNGNLLIFVDSPVVLFHLNLKRALVKEKIQKITKEFKDIILKVGRVK